MTRGPGKGLLVGNEVFPIAMHGRPAWWAMRRDAFVIALMVSVYRSVGSLPGEDREKRNDPVSSRQTDDTTLLLPWFFQVAGSPNPFIPLIDPGTCSVSKISPPRSSAVEHVTRNRSRPLRTGSTE